MSSCGCERGSARKQSGQAGRQKAGVKSPQGLSPQPSVPFACIEHDHTLDLGLHAAVACVWKGRRCPATHRQRGLLAAPACHRCKAGAVPPSLRPAPAAGGCRGRASGSRACDCCCANIASGLRACKHTAPSPSSTPPQEQSHCGASERGLGPVLMPRPSVVGGRAGVLLYVCV